MNILVTGATGFLGKHVLAQILRNPRVERVFVTSRKPLTHPDPRVVVVQGDISEPATWVCRLPKLDHIVHLAGLYDFTKALAFNYRQNVLPALNLVDFIRAVQPDSPPLIHFASTYAVGFGSEAVLTENPLVETPAMRQPYPYTKAVAEKILTDSGLPCRVFRLGVLVGDETHGTIEKIDGPYYVFRLAWKLGSTPLSRVVRHLPLPLDENGLLPVVPVDAAARVFAASLFEHPSKANVEVYNVVDTESASLKQLATDCFQAYLPNTRIAFSTGFGNSTWLEFALKAQSYVTGIPSHALEFGLRPVRMENARFVERFGSDAIPPYPKYRQALLRGFATFMDGKYEST